MEQAMFKSPVTKLLKFFEKSRNGWKAKCQRAKERNKRLATQTRAVERSRAAWRQRAELAERELRDLKQELETLKNTAVGCGAA
jgi:lipopolysaccharide export system protein LptC